MTSEQALTVRLPPLQVRIELKPAETEVIGSNLDAEETAKLFELARSAFERGAERPKASGAGHRIRAAIDPGPLPGHGLPRGEGGHLSESAAAALI